MKLEAIKMGSKYGGSCAVCGRHTGDRGFELAGTVLCKDEDGKYHVVHAKCCPAAAKRMRGYILEGKTSFSVAN